MQVGSGSAKQWVVREMTAACGCEDVVLACAAREFLIFRYLHNISDIIAATMDPKGKLPATIYRAVNMAGRSKKRKARAVEPSDSVRSLKLERGEVLERGQCGGSCYCWGSLGPFGCRGLRHLRDGVGDEVASEEGFAHKDGLANNFFNLLRCGLFGPMAGS